MSEIQICAAVWSLFFEKPWTGIHYIILLNTLFQFTSKFHTAMPTATTRTKFWKAKFLADKFPHFEATYLAGYQKHVKMESREQLSFSFLFYILDGMFQTLPLAIIFVLNDKGISSVTWRYSVRADLAYVYSFAGFEDAMVSANHIKASNRCRVRNK